MIKLGVIADDFTGATDIASFMAEAGWRVILFNGVPAETVQPGEADAIVIALKSRSVAAGVAVEQSLGAGEWLLEMGCQQLFFKYCSTFDSTAYGNIGPVTDALMKLVNASMTVLCPAVPDNGRTIVHGHLFVKGQLLNHSGMQHHPVTPMMKSSIKALMEEQSTGLCGIVDLNTVKNAPDDIARQLEQLAFNKIKYVVFDVLDNQDLRVVASKTRHFRLVTGAAGLGSAIARLDVTDNPVAQTTLPVPKAGKAIILSGSCSSMTNQQVNFYSQRADALALDIEKIVNDESYLPGVLRWAIRHADSALAPLIYATQPPQLIEAVQKHYGAAQVSEKIERFFSQLADRLRQDGFNKFIVAGGETSGAVTQGLHVTGMVIGHTVAPGVPWTQSRDGSLWMILKSGNFGAPDFFLKAQENFQ
ncbi:3-oxo-tetronate kinase [Kosakonia sp. BK9b]